MDISHYQQRSRKFRKLVSSSSPLQIAGTINAYTALLAEKAGFQSIYLSGAGVANASFGLPDLGVTTLENVSEDVRRIAQASRLPLLVDADTGWDDPEHAIRQLSIAGAAAIHIEDQIDLKRCGHRPGKNLVSIEEMQERIRSAVCGCDLNPDFVIMARTDSHAVEGFHASIDRSKAYIEAGAHMIFAEAYATLDEYKLLTDELDVPVLANITEFGKTPLFTVEELKSAGIAMALYPLTAFRAMSASALSVYETVRQQGTQKSLLDKMQTRAELYEILNYERYEKEIDKTLAETLTEKGGKS